MEENSVDVTQLSKLNLDLLKANSWPRRTDLPLAIFDITIFQNCKVWIVTEIYHRIIFGNELFIASDNTLNDSKNIKY